jgi:hypothetical protein
VVHINLQNTKLPYFIPNLTKQHHVVEFFILNLNIKRNPIIANTFHCIDMNTFYFLLYLQPAGPLVFIL